MSTRKQKPPRDSFFLGLDLGGTNIKAGVVDRAGRLRSHVQIPTGTDFSPTAVVTRLIAVGEEAIAGAAAYGGDIGVAAASVRGVGIVCPGLLDVGHGMVRHAANFPGWRNVRLRQRVCRAFRVPAVLENDANAAAYGEWWVGAGRGTQSVVVLTLGTGVGAGIILGGRIVRGAFGLAGEIGHMVLVSGGEPCGCGQRGCVERYCSARFFARRVERQLQSSAKLRRSSSLGRAMARGEDVTAEAVAWHVRAGDPFARAAWGEMCGHLALACINICRVVDPEMIVLAGGLAGAGSLLLNGVSRELKARWWKLGKPGVTLALGKLGQEAGVIGAAGLAMVAC